MADNHKIKNIYYMLSYAYQTLSETGYDNVASEDFDNIHDLLAAILVHGVGTQVKRGLHRDYMPYEEDLSGLRGKVKISDSLKRQARPKGRLMCAFDEFTQNSPHNQVLKSVLLLLLRHGKVKTENKKSMRKLLLYFSQVEDIIPSEIRWDALKYHRNNASYRMLIEICRFAVEGLLLTEETGRHKLATWIQDEKMHYLYQRFVLAYYKRHHSEYEPSAAHIDWDITAGEKSGYLPRMETDITLQNGDKKVIIDTKYYSKSMAQNQYGGDKYHEYHLYQMYAYVKNSDKNNSGNVAGVLLYAKTDENTTPDEDLFLSGNRISLKTLDLDKEWKEIAAQLDEVCAWLEYDGTK
jgi:5-methylcytosine-specific restriction enzyme subunit McrC